MFVALNYAVNVSGTSHLFFFHYCQTMKGHQVGGSRGRILSSLFIVGKLMTSFGE